MMNKADAIMYLTEHDDKWEMPDSWWEVSLKDGTILHFSEEIFKNLFAEWRRTELPSMLASVDLYGAPVGLVTNSIVAYWQSTPLIRCRWIVGRDKRHFKLDDEDTEDKKPWDV